ncbi:hypothetical protein EDM80_02115 [bacterium]|nr:MAG: hypothetical protein EDM80_02115 [bacterium]RIK62357.1 MAG: hypothetical protein DCC64_10550 [Planctomycetota bacterium]
MKLAVIVPHLPPTRCGVYDYTRLLARHWPKAASWAVLSPDLGDAWPGASAIRISRQGESLAAGLRQAGADAVLLQYTCYGYADNGVPTWLAQGLEGARPARLAVMFHELFYSGPPWRRAYWRKGRQLALARRLAAMACAVLTGVPAWVAPLSLSKGPPVTLAPIPSNIDPLYPCAHSGPLTLGVFGLEAARLRALRLGRPVIETLLDARVDFTLRLIGAGAERGISAREMEWLEGVPRERVTAEAFDSPADLSKALSACQLVLPAATGPELYKSGTAMAALAHGCALCAVGREEAGIPMLWLEFRRRAEFVKALQAGAARETGLEGRRWYEENSGWPRALEAWHQALRA